MDRTVRYIRMCEKSPLQKLWELKSGDWVLRKYPNAIVDKNKQEVQILIREIDAGKNSHWVIVNEDGEPHFTQGELHKKFFTCLFRQDQLQEMVIPCDEDIMGVLQKFQDYLIKWWYVRSDFWFHITSMEQLWHDFVVYEKYGKRWDNEEGEWSHVRIF